MIEKKIFLHIRFGLGVYIVGAKYGIFAIFSALAISKKVIFSDISDQTLAPKVLREITPHVFLPCTDYYMHRRGLSTGP